MSIYLRTLLIIFSIGTFWYIIRKLRNSQVQVTDSLFWILTAAMILCMSLFPDAVAKAAEMIGIESTVNGVYLVIIFLLLIKIFLLSIAFSQLEYKVRRLTEELGVRGCQQDER